MDSVILQGLDAIGAARLLMKFFQTEAFDLGPDYGQDTVRVWMYGPNERMGGKPVDWVTLVTHWRDDGWFNGWGNFRALFDGPPFRMGGDVAVEGTPL